MIPTSKEEMRAKEYLAMAETAAEKASASPLENVREQHERSAAVWLELARFEQSRVDRRAQIAAATALRLAAEAEREVGDEVLA